MEVILVLTGIVLGLAISASINKFHAIGVLRIDKSDPTDSPYIFLEIKKDIGDIERKKCVVLKVKREDFIPHE